MRALLLFLLLALLEPAFADNSDNEAMTDGFAIETTAAKLAIRSRTLDPFGLPPRGRFKGAGSSDGLGLTLGKTTTLQQPNAPAVPTFSQAIRNLAVDGINVKEGKIFVGSRTVGVGDVLVLSNGGYRFTAWIEALGSNGVLFRSGADTETARKPLRTGPPRMVPTHYMSQGSVSDFIQDIESEK